MTRREVARCCRIDAAKLRVWEKSGVLPPFFSVPVRLYADRVRLLIAGRRVMTMQRLRECLAVAGC